MPLDGFNPIPECELPNLSISDGLITSKETLDEMIKKSPFLLIEISNSKCKECCQTEDLLHDLQNDFTSKKWSYNDQQILIGRIDVNTASSRELLKQFRITAEELPLLVASFQGDFYIYTGSLEKTKKILVIHWINRILNPVLKLTTIPQVERFMNREVEFRETTEFFGNNYIPMMMEYIRKQTATRTVLFSTNQTLYQTLVNESKPLMYRHELRIAIVQDPDIIAHFKKVSDPMHFKGDEDNSLLVRKQLNMTAPYLFDGKNLSYSQYISRHSLVWLEDINADTLPVMNELQSYHLITFISDQFQQQSPINEDMYSIKTLGELNQIFQNKIQIYGIIGDKQASIKQTFGIDPETQLNAIMYTKDGRYTAFPKTDQLTRKSFQQWVVSIYQGRTKLINVPNLDKKANEIKIPTKSMLKIKEEAEYLDKFYTTEEYRKYLSVVDEYLKQREISDEYISVEL